MHNIFAILAILCFLIALLDGRAGWVGMIFLTIALTSIG
jgi:hypothetical protein